MIWYNLQAIYLQLRIVRICNEIMLETFAIDILLLNSVDDQRKIFTYT
jgi:hypothetical protein